MRSCFGRHKKLERLYAAVFVFFQASPMLQLWRGFFFILKKNNRTNLLVKCVDCSDKIKKEENISSYFFNYSSLVLGFLGFYYIFQETIAQAGNLGSN